MGKTKKILCIMLCVSSLAALCAAGSFAAESDKVELLYQSGSGYWARYRINAETGAFIGSGTSYQITSFPFTPISEEVFTSVRNTWYQSLGFQNVDDLPFYFKPSYTYYFQFDVLIQGRKNKDQYTLPTFVSPVITASNSFQDCVFLSSYNQINSATSNDSLLPVQYPTTDGITYYIDNENVDYYTYPSLNVDNTDTWNSYGISFYVTFHCSEDMPLDTYRYFIVRLINGIHMPAVENPDMITISSMELQAYYDPSGDYAEDIIDETDKIIAGQKEAADYALDREKQENQQAYNDSYSDGQSAASSLFSADGFNGGFSGLISAISYTGTNFSFNFPALDIPYFSNLKTPSQEIPLKYWIDQIPPVFLYALRMLAWIGLVFTIIHWIKKFIALFDGNNS